VLKETNFPEHDGNYRLDRIASVVLKLFEGKKISGCE
jgi:hypothetical protein